MTKVDDVVVYHHGRDDNSFHGDSRTHKAVVFSVDADEMLDLVILNPAGDPTIPVSDVRKYNDPQRKPYAAFWLLEGAALPEPLWPVEEVPKVEVIVADEIIIPAEPTKKKTRK